MQALLPAMTRAAMGIGARGFSSATGIAPLRLRWAKDV